MKFDYADAVRAVREHAQHRDNAWDKVAQLSAEYGCSSRDCIINLSDKKLSGDFDCYCIQNFSKEQRPFILALLNYTKHNYEAILPLAESKRMADEKFYNLMCPAK